MQNGSINLVIECRNTVSGTTASLLGWVVREPLSRIATAGNGEAVLWPVMSAVASKSNRPGQAA